MAAKYSNKYVLETGIGLQDVDGLKNSSYFLDESSRYIRGEISLEELDQIISSYYENKPELEPSNEEADKVSIAIAKAVAEDSFVFSVGQLLSIHQSLFQGVLDHPGQLRTYNFSKKEWVLDGASVTYCDYRELERTLQYDFEQEKRFSYRGLSIDEIIEHLAFFISSLWQIHAFEEGNTRTTAVFFIKYLRSLGFDVTNDTFAKNAWYFRNALVRANYTNIGKGIYNDRSYLVLFLRNLLLGEHNELSNRSLHVHAHIGKKEDASKPNIIDLIAANPRITSAELAKALGVSLRTAKSALKALQEGKAIERINGKRYGYWKVNK